MAEEEEKASDMAIAMAGTLLGAISFQMGMYYITNHSDEDIRKYGYDIINSTVSIFAAVLLFQTCNALMEVYVLDGLSMEMQAVVDMGHMLAWYTILQITLAWQTGIIGHRPKNMESCELNLKSIAVLLAHMTGFASINAWGAIQQLAFFRVSPIRSFLVLPISACGQFILQRITDFIRETVSLADDGTKDEYEEKWDEETEECENDVMALTLSFNFTQAVRFLVTSDLPNQEGAEPLYALTHHSVDHIIMIFATGFCCAFGMVVIFMVSACQKDKKKEEEEKEEESAGPPSLAVRIFGDKEELEDRGKDVAIITLSMCFAWCTFYSSKMQLGRIHLVDDTMVLAMLHTMCISVVSFSMISVLDKLADAEWTPDWVDDAIKQFIKGPLSILVGFGWEQCFDQAVDSISSVLPDPHLSKGVLAVFCVAIVVPAWKWYLLPMELQDGWEFGFVIDDDDRPEFWEAITAKIMNKKQEKQQRNESEADNAQANVTANTADEAFDYRPLADYGQIQLSVSGQISTRAGAAVAQLRASQEEAATLRKRVAQLSRQQGEEVAKLKSTLRDALATLRVVESAQQKRTQGMKDVREFMKSLSGQEHLLSEQARDAHQRALTALSGMAIL